MSEKITLSATVREAGKGLQMLRNDGSLPVVLYGHGIESRALTLDHLQFARAFREAGENTIISLSVGNESPVNVLVKDAVLHPTTSRYVHADLFQVRMDEEIETAVPVELIGESPAVREQGGVLVRSLEEIDVVALPADIPHSIVADLARLVTFDDVIKVRDLTVPKGVVVRNDTDTVVVLVERPRTEAEIAALDEKVEEDVTKVEGTEKSVSTSAEGPGA